MHAFVLVAFFCLRNKMAKRIKWNQFVLRFVRPQNNCIALWISFWIEDVQVCLCVIVCNCVCAVCAFFRRVLLIFGCACRPNFIRIYVLIFRIVKAAQDTKESTQWFIPAFGCREYIMYRRHPTSKLKYALSSSSPSPSSLPSFGAFHSFVLGRFLIYFVSFFVSFISRALVCLHGQSSFCL